MATTSEITVMFFPGLSGTVTWGMRTPRMSTCSDVQPGPLVAPLARPIPPSRTTTSMRFCCRIARIAEERRDVDDPDAPDLHVVPLELVAPRDEHVVAAACDVHHVVGHQPVTPLHQVQHALALADPAPPHEQQPHTVHVRQRAVHGGGRRERLPGTAGAADRSRPSSAGCEARGRAGPAPPPAAARHLLPLGHHHGRHVQARRGGPARSSAPPASSEPEVPHLRLPQHLEPPLGHRTVKPVEDRARARDARPLDRPAERARPVEELECPAPPACRRAGPRRSAFGCTASPVQSSTGRHGRGARPGVHPLRPLAARAADPACSAPRPGRCGGLAAARRDATAGRPGDVARAPLRALPWSCSKSTSTATARSRTCASLRRTLPHDAGRKLVAQVYVPGRDANVHAPSPFR